MGSAGDLTRGTPHAAANLIVCAVRMCQSVLASCTAEFDPQDAFLACGAAWARPCLLHIGRMHACACISVNTLSTPTSATCPVDSMCKHACAIAAMIHKLPAVVSEMAHVVCLHNNDNIIMVVITADARCVAADTKHTCIKHSAWPACAHA